jgi:hypothetical protein
MPIALCLLLGPVIGICFGVFIGSGFNLVTQSSAARWSFLLMTVVFSFQGLLLPLHEQAAIVKGNFFLLAAAKMSLIGFSLSLIIICIVGTIWYGIRYRNSRVLRDNED